MAVSQRRVIGGVLKVPLGGRWHAYAWTLPEVDFALFDLRTDAEMPAAEVVTHPVAFRVNGQCVGVLGRPVAADRQSGPAAGSARPGADFHSGSIHRPILDLPGRRHSFGHPCRVHRSGVLCGVGAGARRAAVPGSLRRSPVQVDRADGGRCCRRWGHVSLLEFVAHSALAAVELGCLAIEG